MSTALIGKGPHQIPTNGLLGKLAHKDKVYAHQMDAPMDLPSIRPSLLLDFANSKTLDPRITFTRASTATRVNARGLIETVATNSPRFDHDPTTGESLGLLIEEARTNEATYSEQFDNGAWSTKTQITVTANAAVAPDGTLTADKLVETTATFNHWVGRNISTAANTTVTWSVFVKAAERTVALVQVGGFGNQVASNAVFIDLLTGAFTANDTSRTKVESYPNGWWRVSTTVTSIGSTVNLTPSVYVTEVMGNSSHTGNGTSGIYVWGGQFEVGAFPTSYIPAVASTVTRQADLASIPSSIVASFWNPNEFTIVQKVSGRVPTASDVTTGVSLYSSGNDRLRIGLSSSGANFCAGRISEGSTRTATLQTGLAPASLVSGTYSMFGKTGEYFGCTRNGLTPIQVSTGNTGVFTGTPAFYLSNYDGSLSQQPSGHINFLHYYPKRLTNAELQAVTR